jgi:hypothetical protein
LTGSLREGLAAGAEGHNAFAFVISSSGRSGADGREAREDAVF